MTEEKLCKCLKWSNAPLVGNYHLYCDNPKCEEYKKILLGDECDECKDKVTEECKLIDAKDLIEYGNNLISLHQLYPQESLSIYEQAIKDMLDGISESMQRWQNDYFRTRTRQKHTRCPIYY